MDPTPKTPLDQKLHHHLQTRLQKSTLRTLTLPSPTSVDFSSNDFLSLSSNPLLKKIFLSTLQSPNFHLGSGGSRLLDGNSTFAEDLEKEIAAFHGAETGLLFNSGFDANAGFFGCVPQRGDVVVYDEFVHASVHDGMRLSRAEKTIPFKHNCVESLRNILVNLKKEMETEELGTQRSVIVAVESIYSMDGDVAPLREIVSAVENTLPQGTGYIVVDEAHSTGVLGPQGRGLVCELGLEKHIFARLHTFGKALAGNGAILLTSPTTRTYLTNYSRPLIYTTFLSHPSLSLIASSYTLLKSNKTTPLQTHLHHLIQTLFSALLDLQHTSPHARNMLKIPSACPKSPIFAVQLKRPRDLARFLQGRGMMVRAVVPPTVPKGTERVRVCLHAGNTVDELGVLVKELKEWCEQQQQAIQQLPEQGESQIEERARL